MVQFCIKTIARLRGAGLISLWLCFAFLQASAASNQSLVYQGRIVRPDGTPIISSSVTFSLSVYSPAPSKCLLYSETQVVDMTGSQGMFSLNLGSGTRTDSGAHSFNDVFVNGKNLTALSCASGTSYSGATNDDRNLSVSFNDNGTVISLSPVNIKSVPFALQAHEIDGWGLNNIVKVSSIGSPTTFTTSEMANAKLLTTPGPCAANDILKWNGSAWLCSADATGGSPSDASYLAKGVFQADTDAAISGLAFSSPGVLKVNVGTGANQIVKLDASSKLPAVDASALTNLSATNISSGTVGIARGGTGATTKTGAFDALSPNSAKGDITVHNGTNNVALPVGSNGQVLTADSAQASGVKWANVTAGTVTSVTAGTGLTGGTITNTGTLSVNVGTGANQIVQLDASSKLPAVDGSALTGLTASQVSSGTIPVTRGGTGTGSFAGNGVIVSNLTGSQLSALNCGSGQVITFDGSGYAICGAAAGTTGFVNGGNSFGGTTTLGTNDNNDLNFETNSTTRMTITTSGDVGVGTLNPGSRLDVAGTINSSVGFTVGGASGGVAFNSFSLTGATNGQFAIYNNSANAAAFTAITGGKNAASHLDLASTSVAGTTDYIRFLTGSTSERMRIDTNGNVGIGTSTPAESLEVAGIAKVGTLKIGSNVTEKTFQVSFSGSTANQKVDLVLGNVATTASFVVSVASSWSGENAIGVLEKTYAVGFNPNNAFTHQETYYSKVLGPVATAFAISDVSWDAANTTYRIQIVHRTALDNPVYISIRGLHSQANTVVKNTTVGSVYTTDATVFSKPQVNFPTNVGINVSSPGAALDVKDEIRISGATSGYAGLKSPAVGPSVTWTLPLVDGSAGQFLKTDGSGNLSWGSASSSGVTSINGSSVNAQSFAAPGTSGTAPAWSSNTGTGVHTLNIPMASTASVTAGLISKTEYDSFNTKLSTTSVHAGDISGPYNAITVDKIKGTALTISSLSSGDLLKYNGSGWVNASLSSSDITGALTYTPVNRAGDTMSGALNMSGSNVTNVGQLSLKDSGANTISLRAPSSVTSYNFTLPSTAGSSGQVLTTDGSGNLSWLAAGGTTGFVNGGNSFGGTATLGTNDNNSLNIKTNGTTRVIIDTSGNLAIGTNAPSYPFEISRPGQANDVNTTVMGIGAGTDATLGNLTYAVLMNTSATAGSRYVSLSVGDNVATRPLILNRAFNGSVGNVGIGLTDPVARFEIAAGGTTVGTSEQISLRSNRVAIGNGSMIGGINFRSNDTSLASPGSVVAAIDAVGGAAHTTTTLDTDLVFHTTSGTGMSERMRIDSLGNVGIGTSSPATALEIDQTTSNIYSWTRAGAQEFALWSFYNPGNSGERRLAFYKSRGTSSAPLAVQSSDVLSTIYSYGYDGSGHNQATAIRSWTDGTVSTGTVPSRIEFQTFDTSLQTRMVIKSTGNVGIGTSSPGAPLDVKGEIRMSGATSGYAGFKSPAVGPSVTWTLPSADGSAGQLLKTDGAGNLSWTSVSATAITSINGSSVTAQSFAAPGTSGTAPAWSSNTGTGVHTLNIPMANTASVTAGLISKTEYDSFNAKLGTTSVFVGDISGPYNAITVDKIKGTPVSISSLSNGQFLKYNGAAWVNSSLSINATTDITAGTLPVSKGGTGVTSLTANRLLASDGTGSTIQPVSPCAQYQVLGFDASGNYVCYNISSLSGFVNNGNTFGSAARLGTNDAYSLIFATNNTNRMAIDNTGNVGIGTTSPQAKLDVVDGVIGTRSNTMSPMMAIYAPTSNTLPGVMSFQSGRSAGAAFNQSGDSMGNIDWRSKTGLTTDVAAQIKTIATETQSASATGGAMIFSTTPNTTRTLTERMRIDQNGNIGVGITNPSTRLQIGTSDSDASTALTTILGSYYFGVGGQEYNTNSYRLIGLGYKYATNNHFPGYIGFQEIDSTSSTNGDLVFGTRSVTTDTAPSERMRIAANGNIGVATTTPQAALDLKGDVIIRSNTTTNWHEGLNIERSGTGNYSWLVWGTGLASNAAPDGTTADFLFGQNAGDSDLWLLSRGFSTGSLGRSDAVVRYGKATGYTMFANRVGIGTSTPGYMLHVVGTAGLSTGTAWTNASDIRLKNIDGDYEYGLNEILKLHTVRFHYKPDNALNIPSDHPMTGFIAQEVQKVIPDAVHERDDGYLEMNVDPIHWATVNAVKELHGMCKMTESQMQAIRKKVEAHERRIASIESENQKLKSEVQRVHQENDRIAKENAQLKERMDQIEKLLLKK